MRALLLAGVALAVATPALSQTLDCTGGTVLDQNRLRQLLDGRYAWGPVGGPVRWNVGHAVSPAGAGQFMDYKRGPGHPRDASRVMGTYAYSNLVGGNQLGVITYSYAVGGTYAYQVRAAVNPQGPPGPGIYSFCGINGAQNFLMTVSVGPGPVQ